MMQCFNQAYLGSQSSMGVESELNCQILREAISQHDIAAITRLITESQFVLIHLADDPPGNGGEKTAAEELLGALIASDEGSDYLVAFSNQKNASRFVELRSDLFENDSEVSGFWVDGRTMLDYLDDELGILLNPDGEGHRQIEPALVQEILDELGLEL